MAEQTGGGTQGGGSSQWSRRGKLVAGPKRGDAGGSGMRGAGAPAPQQQAAAAWHGDLLTSSKLRTQPLTPQEQQLAADVASTDAPLPTPPFRQHTLLLPPISSPAPASGAAAKPAAASSAAAAAAKLRGALDPAMPAALGTAYGVHRKVPPAVLALVASRSPAPDVPAPGTDEQQPTDLQRQSSQQQMQERQYVNLADTLPPEEEEAAGRATAPSHPGGRAPLSAASAGGAARHALSATPPPQPWGVFPQRPAGMSVAGAGGPARGLRHSMSAPGPLARSAASAPAAAASAGGKAGATASRGAAAAPPSAAARAATPAPPEPQHAQQQREQPAFTHRALLEAGVQHFVGDELPSQGWAPGALGALRDKPPAGELVFDADYEVRPASVWVLWVACLQAPSRVRMRAVRGSGHEAWPHAGSAGEADGCCVCVGPLPGCRAPTWPWLSGAPTAWSTSSRCAPTPTTPSEG